MTRPSLIDEIEKNAEFRKQKKQELDRAFRLSNSDDKTDSWKIETRMNFGEYRRLIDEGAILHGDGSVRLYLCKGVLKEFYDRLSSDYIGTINTGHVSVRSDPTSYIGKWTKDHLKVVDLDDQGRKALDIKVELNKKMSGAKDLEELANEGIPVGISAELELDLDKKLTEKYGFPVAVGVNITDFAVVGDYGNASSGGMYFNNEGGKTAVKKEQKNPVELALEKLSGWKKKEPVVEEVEPVVEEVEPVVEEVEPVVEEDKLANNLKMIDTLTMEHEKRGEAILELTALLEEKTAENEKLSKANKEYEEAIEKIGVSFEKVLSQTASPATETQPDSAWGKID